MKTLVRNFGKSLSSLAVITILILNIQIGTGNNLFAKNITLAEEFCPPLFDVCGWVVYPGGTIIIDIGKPITIIAEQ